MGNEVQKHYSVPECEKISGIRASTWRKWILTRRVGYSKIGRLVRIPESELRRMLESGLVPPREVNR
jgi:hypothetical protein